MENLFSIIAVISASIIIIIIFEKIEDFFNKGVPSRKTNGIFSEIEQKSGRGLAQIIF